MDKNDNALSIPEYPWLRKVQRLISSGQKAYALRILDRVVDSEMPLFWDDPSIQESRRFAWLFRIQLLREWGRLSEALAWTCLECEINPGNVAARALKEQMKRLLRLGQKRRSIPAEERDTDLWKGVAGMREIKVTLEQDIILPLQQPELFRHYKITLPNGILFYGPPGCGKTFIARKLAEILTFNFLEVRPADLGSIYVHGGQQKIKALFEEARRKAPTLLFFDEVDALLPNRSGKDVGHHYKSEVAEFLVQLNNCWESRVFVLAATNNLEGLDPAACRPGRIDKKIFIGPPDLEARVDMLRLYMEGRPQDNIDWVKVAETMEYYTCAEIEHLVNEAARTALLQARPITQQDLIKSVGTNPPGLNGEAIQKMRAPIGFV